MSVLTTKDRHLICCVHQRVRHALSGTARKHALKVLRQRAHKLKLQLPVTRSRLHLPWFGNVAASPKMSKHFLSLIKDLVHCDLMQHSAFDARYQAGAPRIRCGWSACPSVLDKCRNAATHTKRCLMNTVVCPCDLADLQWLPHVTGVDGLKHIIAKQGQINWSSVVDDVDVAALCRSISAKTRLQPTKKWMRSRIFAAVVKWIRQHKMPWSTWSAEDITVLVHGLALRHTDQLMRTWNETWHAAGPKLRGCWDFANFAADQFHELARDLVVEMLDKNSGELSFTCPRIWALSTQQAFG